MTAKTKSVVLRFVRATIAGAVANMVVLVPFAGSSLKDLQHWIAALALAGIVGAVGGLIMALDKYLRS